MQTNAFQLNAFAPDGAASGAAPAQYGMVECSDGVDELFDFEDTASYDFDGTTVLIQVPPAVPVLLNPELPDFEALDDLEEVWADFQATGPPADNEVSFDTKATWIDQSEEAEDEDFGFVDAPRAADNDNAADQVEFPDQSEEPDDEDYSFASAPLPPDFVAPDQTVYPFEGPAEAEEPEPEDFGFLDSQVPPDDTGQTTYYLPDESEEPDDEDFAFLDPGLQDYQLYGAEQYPSESEEPDDEDYGTQGDYQLPPDFIPPDQTVYPFEGPSAAEEPEDEDYSFSDSQILEAVVVDLIVCIFPDEAEEPEDEDFSFADAPIPADAVTPTQDQFYPTLGDDVPEDEEEPYGFDDMQLPEDFIPPIPPAPIVGSVGSSGGGGGGRELNKLFRKRDETPEFPGRKVREILDGMELPGEKGTARVPPDDLDDDDDLLLLL